MQTNTQIITPFIDADHNDCPLSIFQDCSLHFKVHLGSCKPLEKLRRSFRRARCQGRFRAGVSRSRGALPQAEPAARGNPGKPAVSSRNTQGCFFYETQLENVCWDLSVIPVSVCAQTEVGFTDLAGFGPQGWARTRGPPPGLEGRREGRTELLQDLPSDLDAD